jgi:uncharacterized protein YprB with RNaseH-like and TPR domain
MVCDRGTRHRLLARGKGPAPVHCDLLHHARRRWKRHLPDCRLQTLERLLCRRFRRDDLGSSQVPAAYHAFVRTGEAGPMRAILAHNALDLVTLVELSMRLLAIPKQGAPPAAAG